MTEARRAAASRRTFLKAVGSAFGAAVLPLGASHARGDASSNPYDVVVIGGGFAGVTAARELRHAGLRVVILEARSRLGGRTFTARVGEQVFELGGTWIHWTQPHAWAEVNRYGLDLVAMPDGLPERVLWWNGEETRESGWHEILPLVRAALCAGADDVTPGLPRPALQSFTLLDELMSEFHAEAPLAFPRPFDPFFSAAWRELDRFSIRDRIERMELSRDHRAILEGVLGASAHGAFAEASLVEMLRWWALSGNDLSRYLDSVARYRIREGTARLIEVMIADARPDIRLGAPVARLTQAASDVEVVTTRGEVFRARAAIVALPMNVLANVEFSPPLDPKKVAASKERHAGAGVKVYVRVRGEMPSVLALAPESEPFSTLITAHVEKGDGILIGFGTDPAKIDVHSRAAVEHAVQKFLPEIEVTETIAWDWHADPYSLGTWCILRRGQMTRFLEALREPEGRVHFAGSDFALGWRGFIDGAIESGSRVGREVSEQLRV